MPRGIALCGEGAIPALTLERKTSSDVDLRLLKASSLGRLQTMTMLVVSPLLSVDESLPTLAPVALFTAIKYPGLPWKYCTTICRARLTTSTIKPCKAGLGAFDTMLKRLRYLSLCDSSKHPFHRLRHKQHQTKVRVRACMSRSIAYE